MIGRFALAFALLGAPLAGPTTGTAVVQPPSSAAPRAIEIEVPKNDGWVTDIAAMISPAKEAELERLMESYRQGSTHEVAVLTVPSLKGEPIENFALEVGRAWRMGSAETSNAALLVVSRDDRIMRIEVARGLEGNLTDLVSGRIIRDVITPEFRKGRFEEGIESGVRAIHAAIGGDYGALPARSPQTDTGILGATIPILFFLLMIWLMSRRGPRGRGGRRARSGMPWIFPPTIGGGGFGGGGGGFGGGGGGFGGFGGGGGFSGGGASGRW